MHLLTTAGFDDYKLLDTGNGYRLEKVGPYILKRPDPQCMWQPSLNIHEWSQYHAFFDKNSKRDSWNISQKMPDEWCIKYKQFILKTKLTPFKHTGIFPEQHLHWDWMFDLITNAQRPPRVLNLFAYTGIASIVCAAAGAHVTHVDASKPAITWAHENQALSGLDNKPIRWILEDCLKFVDREYRRSNHYDAIIMDPPVYGHGPDGKPWDFTRDFPELLTKCMLVLSQKPLFILINAYAVSASSLMLENILAQATHHLPGLVQAGELCLKENNDRGFLLSTGLYARWNAKG